MRRREIDRSPRINQILSLGRGRKLNSGRNPNTNYPRKLDGSQPRERAGEDPEESAGLLPSRLMIDRSAPSAFAQLRNASTVAP